MTDQAAAARADRLKAALRENLKRRKAQARDRQGAERGELRNDTDEPRSPKD